MFCVVLMLWLCCVNVVGLTLGDMCSFGFLDEEQVLQFFGRSGCWSFSRGRSCSWFLCNAAQHDVTSQTDGAVRRANSKILNWHQQKQLRHTARAHHEAVVLTDTVLSTTVCTALTFDSHFGLAKVTADVIGGLAEVIASVVSGGWADLQTRGPVREADPGAAGRRQVLPVLHPLDLQRWRPADVTPETQLIALVHSQRFELDVKHWRLLGLCRRHDDSLTSADCTEVTELDFC